MRGHWNFDYADSQGKRQTKLHASIEIHLFQAADLDALHITYCI